MEEEQVSQQLHKRAIAEMRRLSVDTLTEVGGLEGGEGENCAGGFQGSLTPNKPLVP